MNKNILFKRNENSKFAHFAIMFRGGSSIENIIELGYSHLIEHLVLQSGGSSSINELFDYFGANIKGETSREYVCFSGYCRLEDFNELFSRTLEKIWNLNICENELERERKTVLIELEQYGKIGRSIDYRYIYSDMWQEDIIGTPESIANVELKLLKEFYYKYIFNGDCVICVSGPDSLTKVLDNLQIDITNDHKIKTLNRPNFSKGITILSDTQSMNEIRVYYDISKFVNLPKDVAALSIFNALLTGVKGSYLGDQLRNERRWIYSVGSFPILYSNFTLFKLFTKVPKEYRIQLVELLEEKVFDIDDYKMYELFQKAKRRVSNELIMISESNRNNYLKSLCKEHLFKIPSLETIESYIESVQIHDIIKFSNNTMLNNPEKHIFID
ncbi:insulinase family protein [Streptococcus sp. 121]|uniref:M16 family metallopeptidase n=1 Tax=Streptococcus sp. 121 TaxID=2797637 RepID=UPI0018F07D8F|nr:insulinase family protein [Streptococcus sp. 121]MBJ6746400.1 insulinase family protein [Streptococcus sp. 121]